jgi:hypothetical protein
MQTNSGVSFWDMPLFGQVYTFVEKDGTATHIATTVLLQTLKRAGVTPVLCVYDQTLVQALERGDLGVEVDHALALPEARLDVPGIVGQWGDEHIMIDGAHRLWRRWKRGDPDFPAYYLAEHLWRRFVINDMPQELSALCVASAGT